MKKVTLISAVCLILLIVCFSLFATEFTVRQMVLTITIPDDNSSGIHQTELIVPDGTVAVNFTVWGIVDTWGIQTENTDLSGEPLFVYSPDRENPEEYIDSESSESVDSGGDTVGYGYDHDSELSHLTLPPGTYIVWLKGSSGTTITIQYLLEER